MNQKWAFVSDYVRLWAIYHQGGIYLDTDVEVKKSLDSFLSHDFLQVLNHGNFPLPQRLVLKRGMQL